MKNNIIKETEELLCEISLCSIVAYVGVEVAIRVKKSLED